MSAPYEKWGVLYALSARCKRRRGGGGGGGGGGGRPIHQEGRFNDFMPESHKYGFCPIACQLPLSVQQFCLTTRRRLIGNFADWHLSGYLKLHTGTVR